MPAQSAGLLLYRSSPDASIEVLLGHMGGPFWALKDEGAWSIPKGLVEPGEDPLATAVREFTEELGSPPPAPPYLDLGAFRQSSKVVHVWAVEGDLDAEASVSATFTLEWPPRSGRMIEVPELDRVGWFGPDEARARLVKGQAAAIDELLARIRIRRI
jgi:predicted NUDIX family NTP pyrophosphohydrolase